MAAKKKGNKTLSGQLVDGTQSSCICQWEQQTNLGGKREVIFKKESILLLQKQEGNVGSEERWEFLSSSEGEGLEKADPAPEFILSWKA